MWNRVWGYCVRNGLSWGTFGLAVFFVCLASGCNGSSSSNNTSQASAPTNLVYPQSLISAVVGTAIQADTPTVSGTVTGFTVSPQLPAGLTLSQSSGMISGTPTAAAASASYTITASNSGGTTSTTVLIAVSSAAPTNLAYSQPLILAIAGSAITPDTPTVTGTVTGYSVSPTLPAGLTLNQTTGVISGTPTAVSVRATYTITGSNAAGSVNTTIQINVDPIAPSNLVYPQTTINATVRTAIQADTPTISGSVAYYAVSPALPAGLTLDATSGTIAGTPVQGTAQATYTVTATDTLFRSTTAQVTIMVTQTSQVLLELGHGTNVVALRTVGQRVLSQDAAGHWNLWDYTTAQILKSGDGGNGLIDLAGQVATIGTASTVQVLSAVDGSSMATIPNGTWWKLASDGSYVCTGSSTALTTWSANGGQQASRAGDYHAANVFAAATQIQVAFGPAGSNVIETVSPSDGSSTVSPAFLGVFSSWFTDGQRFLTTLSNSVWTYSSAGIQEASVTLPSVSNLTGQGSWIWTLPAGGGPLQVYAIGASTPTSTFSPPVAGSVLTSGLFAGLLDFSSTPEIDILDLSGTAPSLTKYPTAGGLNYPVTFAASSATQWVGSYQTGAVVDGASLSTTPRFFGYGTIQGMAGAPNKVALSTSTGQVLLMDPTGATATSSIDFWGGPVVLSSDGTVLGVGSGWAANSSNDAVNFYSLPSQNLIGTFPFTYPDVADFTLSTSGNAVGIIDHLGSGSRYVSDLSGKASWSDSGVIAPIYLSPDGTLVAAPSEKLATSTTCGSPLPTTTIYKNGVLAATLSNTYGEGWSDNNDLLGSTWGLSTGCFGWAWSGNTISNSTGGLVSTIPVTSPLPGFVDPTFPTTSTVFDPDFGQNALYSLSSGNVIWKAPSQASAGCAVSGTYVACQVGHQVVLYSY